MFVRSLRSIATVSAAIALAVAPAMCADEGMWTFDNPPLKLLKAKYNFVPTQAWLDHLRLSSVRLNDGGSGSFVSPNGLLLTNHHVARGQLQKDSTAEHDYLRDGFYATTPEQEMKSPDLEVDVLVAMQDVTARVQGAVKGITDNAKALKAREAEIAAIEKEGKDKAGLRSDVVGFYEGGEYWLYQYKAYTDVRLVFAPEQQAAFYGGDPDNFTYPRYDLDMALFRVYENGKPLHTDNYLKWSAKGAGPDELVFISGHPGSTERDDTVAELLLQRDVVGPALTEYLQRRVATAQAFAAQGAEQARLVGSTIFGLQNSLKVFEGRADALADKAIMAKKEAEEADFKAKVDANKEWKKEYGSAWDDIAKAEEKVKPEIKGQLFRRTDSRLFSLALTIVEYVTEIKKPDGERLQAISRCGPGRGEIPIAFAGANSNRDGKAVHVFRAQAGRREAGQQRRVPAGDFAGRRRGQSSELADRRNQAWRSGGAQGADGWRRSGGCGIDRSNDCRGAARGPDPARKLTPHPRFDRQRAHAAGEKLGKARFLVYGKDAYPDATFTLRLSYGTVTGYPYNGTIAPPITTFYGLYDRAASFDNKPPFDLTPKEIAGATSWTWPRRSILSVRRRHYWRQLGFAGGEPRWRDGGSDVRRQYRVNGRRFCV